MSSLQAKPSIQRFGEKLKDIRLNNGLTLKKFAESLGYKTHSYISELETGKKMPPVEFILNVSRIYHVTTDELIKDEIELNFNTQETT